MINIIRLQTSTILELDNGWQPPKDPNYKPTPQAKPQTTQSQPQQQKSIDIDHKEDRDPKLAQKIITGLNTYTEYSPSGKGYHLFVLGNTRHSKAMI